MKIAFIVGSLTGGGAERVVSEIASEMAEKGHEVSVLLIASMEQTYRVSKKVNIIDCSKRYPSFGFIHRVAEIRRQLKKICADVCVSFTVAVNIYAILSCFKLPTRLVVAERNDPRYDPKSKATRALRTILYPLADSYVFQTQEERAFFSKGIQQKGTVIPNPVNPALPEFYHGDRTKRFVTAVRLTPQKNIKLAIDAFAVVAKKHHDFIFEIYGQGYLHDELEKYANDKGLNDRVIFKGNSRQLYEDIQDAYAFILSSDYEGMSNSMLEAMALGIPTVSTDYPSGGARAVIENGVNGLLVPVRDTKAMCQAMKRLIEDPDFAKQIGEKGAEIRKTLSVEVITKMWIKFIEA